MGFRPFRRSLVAAVTLYDTHGVPRYWKVVKADQIASSTVRWELLDVHASESIGPLTCPPNSDNTAPSFDSPHMKAWLLGYTGGMPGPGGTYAYRLCGRRRDEVVHTNIASAVEALPLLISAVGGHGTY